MSHQISPGIASKKDLRDFFNVGDDKLNEILSTLGLSTQRGHDWTTIWGALGLDTVQKCKIWDVLQAPLLDVADVACIIGKRPKTVSGWCKKGVYPSGLPAPFDFGPRTKRWIELEVWAYRQPAVYRKDSKKIGKHSPSSHRALQRPPRLEPLLTTLDLMAFG